MALEVLGNRSLKRRKLVMMGTKRSLHAPPDLEAEQQNWGNMSIALHSPEGNFRGTGQPVAINVGSVYSWRREDVPKYVECTDPFQNERSSLQSIHETVDKYCFV